MIPTTRAQVAPWNRAKPARMTEPDYAHGTPLDAASGHSTQQENVITWLRGLGARSASSD